jgi:cysteine desulfurase
VMMANNETGVLQPVQEIGRIATQADVYFHTDAVQAAGKIAIDVKEIGCDLLSISAHKFHGPQGMGALYVRRGTLIDPLFYGGNHERQRRAGTENVAGIIGLGCAAEIAIRGFYDGSVEAVRMLRDRLEEGLIERIEAAGVNSGGGPRVLNTSNIYFDHIEGEAMVIALDLKGLAVSTGAACSSGAIEPSHVLTAMGLAPERARASIRFSVGKHNSDEDIQFALSVIPSTIARLRELSPTYGGKKPAASLMH